MYAHEARMMVQQKEKETIEQQVEKAQRLLDITTKAAEKKVHKQWKEISKHMRFAVKNRIKKPKLQKLLFSGILCSVANISPKV